MEAGELPPEAIHTPGIYVDRIVKVGVTVAGWPLPAHVQVWWWRRVHLDLATAKRGTVVLWCNTPQALRTRSAGWGGVQGEFEKRIERRTVRDPAESSHPIAPHRCAAPEEE